MDAGGPVVQDGLKGRTGYAEPSPFHRRSCAIPWAEFDQSVGSVLLTG